MRKTLATIVTVKTIGKEPEITISSSAADRDGDVLEPAGMDAGHYLRNPVILFGHDHYALPIGRTKSLAVDGDRIRARFSWLENDPDAARVRNAFEQGVLNAASVGFLPQQWKDIEGTYGRRYTKWQLLEWSLVPVPSNPEAVRTLKALGLLGRMPSPRANDNPGFLNFADDEADIPEALVAKLFPHVFAEAVGKTLREELNRLTGRVD